MPGKNGPISTWHMTKLELEIYRGLKGEADKRAFIEMVKGTRKSKVTGEKTESTS